MASNRPIIAADLPSIREVLTHQVNALLFRPDDSSSLADAINLLMANNDLAQRISANALETANNYTWGKRASAIIDFIQKDSLDE
jgi:glycosyltransferase involved in cell wall biosynthesis